MVIIWCRERYYISYIIFPVNADFQVSVKTVVCTGVCLANFTHVEFHNHKLQRRLFEWVLCVFQNSGLSSVFEFLNDCYLICVPQLSRLAPHLSHIASVTDPVIYSAQIERTLLYTHRCSSLRSKCVLAEMILSENNDIINGFGCTHCDKPTVPFCLMIMS